MIAKVRPTVVTIGCTLFFYSNVSSSNLRSLPEIRKGENCVDGQRYRMKCNTCVCRNKSLLCTKMACMDVARSEKVMSQARRKAKKAYKRSRDVTTIKQLLVSDREFLMLPRLPHHAADCTPDKKYKVDCNVCLCNKEGNLECDNNMCVDQKTTRDIEAKKHSDQPCTKSYSTETCVRCKCKLGLTYCLPITDCQTKEDKVMLSKTGASFHRLTFDYKDEECLPGIVYKEKCNKCYCQSDKSLRCTKKLCLNHEQALKLEEQREYLEEHGL